MSSPIQSPSSVPTTPAAVPSVVSSPTAAIVSNAAAKDSVALGDIEMGGIAPSDPKVGTTTPAKPVEDAKQAIKSVTTPVADSSKTPIAASKSSEKSTEWAPPSVQIAE